MRIDAMHHIMLSLLQRLIRRILERHQLLAEAAIHLFQRRLGPSFPDAGRKAFRFSGSMCLHTHSDAVYQNRWKVRGMR